jgi:hypothetical protein
VGRGPCGPRLGLKAHGARADESGVSAREIQPIDVDGVLAALRRGWSIASTDGARLVAGPTGAFVLVAAGQEPEAAADLAAYLAATTRSALAEHVSWVPFIDAIVVTGGGRGPKGPATPIPLDLLGEVLVQGPEMIEAEVLAIVADLLDRGELAGWRTGLRIDDAKIDLCSPITDNAPAT